MNTILHGPDARPFGVRDPRNSRTYQGVLGGSAFRRSTLCMALIFFLAALAAPTADAQDGEREGPERKRDRAEAYRFKFDLDADSLLGDLALHFAHPPFSDLERLGELDHRMDLEKLRFQFSDPSRFLRFDGPGLRIREHMKIAELERESRELARRAREAEGTGRSELEDELRQKLEEIFDAKMELRRERIERFEERLRAERESYQRRDDARESMIERRLRDLMGEDDALEW